MSSEQIDFKDCEGNVLSVWKYNGSFFPRPMAEPIHVRMADINQLEGKHGDVLQVSYPKTGTNWVNDVLTMLKNNNTEVDMNLPNVFLELGPDFNIIANQSVPRSFVTHLPFDKIPESLLKTAKIVLVCRNPKDTAVSFMHHLKRDKTFEYQGDWKAFFGLAVAGHVPHGSFFEYYLAWDEAVRNHPEYKILLVYYEDFHWDPMGTLRKLCDFLEYDRTDELLKAIIDKCQMSVIRAEKEAHPVGRMLIDLLSNDGSLPY